MFTLSLARPPSPGRRGSCALGSVLALAVAAALAALTGCNPAPAVGADAPTPSPASVVAGPAPAPTSVATATLPDTERVLARLEKVSRAGIGASGVAVLSPSGTVVAARDADTPLAPASTLKILTSLAALDVLGADHTFQTRVVGTAKRQLVLIGGGDPMLTVKASGAKAKAASLAALAKATAAELAASGVTKARLGYDDTLFSGPGFHPAWKSSWSAYVARVGPLVVDGARVNPWQSDPEPARTAARAFARLLAAEGVTVTSVQPTAAPGDATAVAAVESAPLALIVERTLRLSDNLAAEVLARHLALATGAEPSFIGAAAGLKEWLSGRGLWTKGMRVVDGSGLSGRSRVTPAVLAGALVAALADDRYAAVIDGLPVAGESGTLKDRFNDRTERIARGNVHAKTGTLPGISGLAGNLTTKDGTPLVFAVLANDTVGQTTAYNWLDRTAAALVRCGCG